MEIRMRSIIVALLASLTLAAGTAHADQNNAELDELFYRLQETSDLFEASQISQEIWRNWYQNDDPQIEELMGEGEARMREADYRAAVETYTRIIEMDPGFAEGWNRRATVYYLMGEYEKSTADVAETLSLEPRHYGALSGQGLIYMAQDQPQKALEYLERALEANPHMMGVKQNIELIRKQQQDEII